MNNSDRQFLDGVGLMLLIAVGCWAVMALAAWVLG
jgi:hypothetical protein